MPNRVAIFIDGAYVDNVLREEFKNVRIDFQALSERMAGESDILRTYYYHCPPFQGNPPTEEERMKYASRRRFFTALELLPKYQVRLGRLARRYNELGEPRFEQKQVDILLSVDLVRLAAKQNIQEAILVTGDSDFVPAITAAKSEGISIRLFHGAQPHSSLFQEADDRFQFDQEFIDSIRR